MARTGTRRRRAAGQSPAAASTAPRHAPDLPPRRRPATSTRSSARAARRCPARRPASASAGRSWSALQHASQSVAERRVAPRRARTAVDEQAQLGAVAARVAPHRLDDVARLEADGLEGGAHQLRPARVGRQAHHQPARRRVPVRRVEAGEGGHEEHAGLGSARSRAALAQQPVALVVRAEQAQLAPQPVDRQARHGHRALQRVHGRLAAAQLVGDRGEQAVAREDRPAARVRQQEAARAVRVLAGQLSEAALADKRGLRASHIPAPPTGPAGPEHLLVSQAAGNRNPVEHGRAAVPGHFERAENLGRAADARQVTPFELEEGEHLRVPVQRAQVHE